MPPRNCIKWTSELRLALLLLHDHFNYDWLKLSRVFSALFAEHLAACGLLDGVEPGRLKAQYVESRSAGPRQYIWAPIYEQLGPPDQISQHQLLLDRLSHIAESLGILPSLTHSSRSRMGLHSTTQQQRQRRQFTNASDVIQPGTHRIRRIVRPAIVVITAEEQCDSMMRHSLAPCTPTKKRPSSDEDDDRVPYTLPSGNIIMLSPEKARQTQQYPKALTDEVISPPLTGLFLRYWDSRSQSPLNDRGEFIAGRHKTLNIAPVPPPAARDPRFYWDDIFSHINRDPVASPFVSVSNHLYWILRLALKEMERGIVDGQIALIDASALPLGSVHRAAPLHRELKKCRPFTNGAWNYQGEHEFLVYHKIPSSAIIKIIKVRDLARLTAQSAALARALQFDIVVAKDWKSRALPYFRSVGLTWSSTALLEDTAKLAYFFGFNCKSKAEHISHFVQDLTQGWGFDIKDTSDEEWQRVSSVFAFALATFSNTGTSAGNATIRDLANMQYAFLHGVRNGLGEFNYRLSPLAISKRDRKARRVGLDSPARIIAYELDGTKLQLNLCEKRQDCILNDKTRRGALNTVAENNTLLGDNLDVHMAMDDDADDSGEEIAYDSSVADADDDDDDDNDFIHVSHPQ